MELWSAGIEPGRDINSLRYFINSDFCLFISMTWHGEEVPIQLGNQRCGFRTKTAGNMSDQLVVVSILLLKHVDKLGS